MTLLAAPTFPPLLKGEAVAARVDPLQKAISAALKGAEPGRLVYAEDESALRAAITLVPDVSLADGMGALLAVELGFADALGALAPPEVAVHFVWPDRIKVNGASCGTFRAAASTSEPEAEPDWLIVALDVPFTAELADPGRTPGTTTLADEGCVEFGVVELLESWSRHTLVWINRFVDEGFAPIHRAWNAKCDDLGEAIVYPQPGQFVGLDERGGLLLRDGAQTRLVPLTALLDPSWHS
ncbi:MAG: DUF4444 domain-containing protein [Pseudomonadota bacterium]